MVLQTGDKLRLTPEYRYLGVVQVPKDTGRRDMDLCARRAQSAWSQARSMLASRSVPWALEQAWLAGKVLPAAYATIATSVAVSDRATSPFESFFECAARQLSGSWQYAHCLTKPLLTALLGLSAPSHVIHITRARPAVQMTARVPLSVQELFDAAWNRGMPSCLTLAEACRRVAEAHLKTGAVHRWEWPGSCTAQQPMVRRRRR